MKNPFTSKDLSETLRRRVELAVAVAQERLLSTHVNHALGLIQLVGDQVPFENALTIYTRMLRLSDDEARVITTRALAILGERAAETEEWPEFAQDARDEKPANGETARRKFMNTFRSRLKGRVNEDLRKFVELAAARTEIAILDTHVDNSMNFVELLGAELSFNDSVELYLEALEVRESVAEVAYYMALTRISEQILPNRPGSDSLVSTVDKVGA
ncbi:MAG TPA: hypothetical protein VM100_03545 [Longimicrobiales bacterium]|nr:hypothetical protein [Longimicrobiales bacterium]